MNQTKYEIAQSSLLGNRKNNQDRCAICETEEGVLLILADGMGGHPKGDVAAQLIIDTCEIEYQAARRPLQDPLAALTTMLKQAHERIVSFGWRHTPSIDPRTTAVLVLVQNEQVWWAHVGDSRFYHFRDNNVLFRTTDHSYVEKLRREGVIDEYQLSTHPYRNYVTRCVGGSPAPPQIDTGGPAQLKQNDILLLCSDGLWGAIPGEDLVSALGSDGQFAGVISSLANQATTISYPESDNVTVAAIKWLQGIRSSESSPSTPTTIPDAVDSDSEMTLEKAISQLQGVVDDWNKQDDENS